MDKKQILIRSHELEAAVRALKQIKFSDKSHQHSDLKPAEIFFLKTIADIKRKKTTPSDIAKKSSVTMAAVTHHLNSLEEKGYLDRVNSEDDRRVIFITLSEKGIRKVKTIEQHTKQKLHELIEHLGDKDSQKMIDLIQKITIFFKKTKGEETK